MNKLGIFINFWENSWTVDYRKYIEKASKIGFDVLEFQAQPLLDFSDAKLSEIRKYADDCGIELTYSLGLDKAYDISSYDENVRRGGEKYLTDIMTQVHKMGGKIISGVSYAGWGVPSYEFEREKLFENSVDSMRRLARIAEEYDITYGIEAVNRFEGVIVNTAADALRYVNAVDNAKVGILLDTYHMNIEENNMGDAIRLAGNKLVGMHTGDNNRLAPGRGHINWNEVFGALKEINFTGRIVSEPFVKTGGEVGRDIYVWRDLMDDVSEAALDKEAEYLLNFTKSMMAK